MEEKKKLYSKITIALGAFLGGPFVAGFLIRRNFLNLGRKKEGLISIVVGIVSTILMLWAIYLVPESAIYKISVPLMLFISVISYCIAEIIQGDALKRHKEEKKEFYSIFGVIGGVFICGVILAIVVLVPLYFIPEDWSTETYDTEDWNTEIYDTIHSNELEAMRLFDKLDNDSKYEIVQFIEQTGIPKWKENIVLINKISNIENLPEEYQKHNKLLLEYSKLRIKTYELISKAFFNETSEYDEEITKLFNQTDDIINEISINNGYSTLDKSSYDNAIIGKDEVFTLEKYRKIKNGMTYEEVVNIIGFEIEPQSEAGEEGTKSHILTYSYYGDIVKGDNAIVSLVFMGGTLTAKTQTGLE